MTLEAPSVPFQRVAPMCEMRDCSNRADYFWHWQIRPIMSWIPVCVDHAESLGTDLRGIAVAPVAESSAPEYRGSDHAQEVTDG